MEKTDFSRQISGDGDIWVEKLCKSKKSGKVVSFFFSTKTPGKSVKHEPPTGASEVIFLKHDYLEGFISRN